MSEMIPVTATINGSLTEFLCQPHHSLLEILRDTLHLTGTKNGCNDGNCGSCSVFLDNVLVNACCVLGVEIDGSKVTTIEGIAKDGTLHPMQLALLEETGLQCGICTPGIIMSSLALLQKHPAPSEAQIRHWLAGNLCRCTGYDRIIKAVQKTSKIMHPGE